MKRLAAVILAVLLLSAGVCRGQEAYNLLTKNYAPYCVAGDDLAFPMKVWALSQDEYAFWRGSRDLYFTWCKGAEHGGDWLGDSGAYVTNHGDLHLGNIGRYAKNGVFGSTSFGAVDFDETARLPFQIELLQGLITLQLAARENNIEMGGRREELARVMFDSYLKAMASGKNTLELVSDERGIGKFIDQAQKPGYEKTLLKFTDGKGHFVLNVHTKHSLQQGPAPKEILRPAGDRTEDMARGIAQALQHSKAAMAAFRYSDIETVRKSIKDVALRTRLESVGSQGLKKYLVLLDKPLKGLDMDVVMYVKQEIPSAAERAGAIPMDPRSFGRRCSEDMNVLTNPTAYMNSWCDIGKESYWVTLKDPWSEDLELKMATDYSRLLELARTWGSVAGAMHRQQGHSAAILERLRKPELFEQLRHRSTLYMAELDRQFHDFLHDPRARADAAKAQKMIDAAENSEGN
jgi:uncharacterized protein (DUF2252 family)